MKAPEFINLVRSLVGEELDNPFAIGTIDAGYVSGLPQVQFDGESTVSLKTRPYLASYTPTAGDRVLLARVNNGWIILGKVEN